MNIQANLKFGQGYWIDRFMPQATIIQPSGGTPIVTKSIPVGSVDGINKSFVVQTFANMQLFLNGLLQLEPDDYSVTNQVTPSGAINGVNKTFILPVTPIAVDLPIYWNGLSLTIDDDYSLSGSTLTMVLAPNINDILTVVLDVGIIAFVNTPRIGDKILAITGITKKYTPTGLVNGSNANYSLPLVPDKLLFQLFENGMLQRESIDYLLNGSNLQMMVAPTVGSTLVAYF